MNFASKKGEIATALTIGTVIVISIVSLISNVFLGKKKQTTQTSAQTSNLCPSNIAAGQICSGDPGTEWCIKCTGQTTATCNTIGLPYHCENNMWVLTNPAGECNSACSAGVNPTPTPVPTTPPGSSCVGNCIYSVGGTGSSATCYRGYCLDPNQSCSFNVNCGYVNSCSGQNQVDCPGVPTATSAPNATATPTPTQGVPTRTPTPRPGATATYAPTSPPGATRTPTPTPLPPTSPPTTCNPNWQCPGGQCNKCGTNCGSYYFCGANNFCGKDFCKRKPADCVSQYCNVSPTQKPQPSNTPPAGQPTNTPGPNSTSTPAPTTGSCIPISSVATHPGIVSLGGDFDCKVTVISGAGSGSVACGMSVNGSWPQNICPSDTRFKGWSGNTATFGCTLPSDTDTKANLKMVGFDFSQACGPSKGVQIPLQIQGVTPPDSTPTATPTPTESLTACIAIRKNGDPASKMNIVMLPSGFTSQEEFINQANIVVTAFDKTNLGSEIMSKLNFWALPLLERDYKASADFGRGVYWDTSMGQQDAQSCGGGGTVATFLIFKSEIWAASATGFGTLVAGTTTKSNENRYYEGSPKGVGNVGPHELGHAIAQLNDEYNVKWEPPLQINCSANIPTDPNLPCPGWEKYPGIQCVHGCSIMGRYRSKETSVMYDIHDFNFNPPSLDGWRMALGNFQ